METKELFEISMAVIGSLGGGAVVVFAFSNWLGKVWANRLMIKEKAEYAQDLESLRNKLTQDTESYKIKLKKSEFLFQKEFEATSEFISFKRGLIPTYHNPGMDWEDVLSHIGGRFKEIELFLHSFLAKHGAVLSEQVKIDIGYATGIAGAEKFPILEEDYQEFPDEKIGEAKDLHDRLVKVEKELTEQVHSQSST